MFCGVIQMQYPSRRERWSCNRGGRVSSFRTKVHCVRELPPRTARQLPSLWQAVGDLNFSVVGTLVTVEGVREQQHKLPWRSQPLVKGSGAGAGNLLPAAGMLYSGCVVASTIRCLNSIGIQSITERTFYNYQRAYLLPAVKQLFLKKQAAMVNSLTDLRVDLAGDGRCDSPGYSAKYLAYSVLAAQNGCILHTEQVQVGESPEVPNSVSMEKQGFYFFYLFSTYCGPLGPSRPWHV
ncbi:uncharacterized protein LOC119406472 [Rhipicephalus sanguineus]|uniref:uncharacterized protein LOC119406472 n=1 Tax=Rhipicephalus sanguineus TaxID=34632 RepID=UPI0018950D2B|nr:uncharacterized protein LOC119406472 [Rhipicephalus sanguineus]